MAPASAQELPILQDSQQIRDLKLKSVAVYFRAYANNQKLDSLEVSHVDFDTAGRLVFEKYFRLFDVILYSEAFSYTYTSHGLPSEKRLKKEDHPLTAEDSAMLDFVGGGESESKWLYEYNKKGQKVKELEFIKSSNAKPNLSTEYQYDKSGRISKAIYQNLKFPEQVSSNNRVDLYTYDAHGRLVLTEMKGTNSNYHQQIELQYDSAGNILSLQRKVNMANIGSLTRYEYDGDNQVSSKHFDPGQDTWKSMTETEYNVQGLKVKESTYSPSGLVSWVSFEYDKNGLLIRETHFNAQGIKAFAFETVYTTR